MCDSFILETLYDLGSGTVPEASMDNSSLADGAISSRHILGARAETKAEHLDLTWGPSACGWVSATLLLTLC